MQEYIDDNPYDYQGQSEYTKSIFIAIFTMMMGAMSAGQSQQFGPDVGKAKAAAQTIFGIMDLKSDINAMDQSDRSNLKKIDFKTF